MMTIGILRGFSILRPVGVDVQAHDQVADFKDSSVSKCLGSSMSFQVTHFVSAGSTTREDAGKKWCPHQLAGYTYHTPNSQSWEPVTKVAS